MASFVQLPSGNWRAVVRRKARYVAETFRRKCDADSWALEMERRIDRGQEVVRAARPRGQRTLADLICAAAPVADPTTRRAARIARDQLDNCLTV